MTATAVRHRTTPRGTRPGCPRRRVAHVERDVAWAASLPPRSRAERRGAPVPWRPPVTPSNGNAARWCSCGQLKMGRPADVDAWWDRHRAGLPEPDPASEASPGRLRPLWRAAADEAVLVHAAVRSFELRRRRPQPQARALVAVTVDTLHRLATEPRGRTILNHNDEEVILIRRRRHGRPGYLDLDRPGKWFPVVSGAAGVPRFWVGGSGTWDTSTTTHWSGTTGGAGGSSAPTSADQVSVDANSGGGTITLTLAVCESLDCTNAPATTIAFGSSSLGVGSSVGGTFKLVANITITNTAGALNFLSSSNNGGTGWAVTTAAKTLPATTFNGTGGKWTLQDAMAATAVTLTRGTLDTNSKACTWTTFTSNAGNTTTLTLGSSAIAMTGAWNTNPATALTMTANTAVLTTSGGTFSTNSKNYNGLTVIATGSGQFSIGSATLAAFTRTGTASKTDSLSLSGDFVVTGAVTLNSNSATNRLLVQSSVIGTPRQITAGSVVITNILDFMDITGAGAATWTVAGTGATAIGDCGGNSGITVSASVAQAWSGTLGTAWSANAWTTRVPLPQDDVTISVSFTSGATVTVDMPRLGRSVNLTGTTSAGVHPIFDFAGVNKSVFGSLTVASSSGVTYANVGGWTLAGRGSFTYTQAGVTHGTSISAPTGTYTMQDALNTGGGSLNLNDGTFDLNGQTATIGSSASGGFASTTGRTRALIATNSTITCPITAVATFWNVTAAGLTLTMTGSTIVLSGAGTASRTFAGAGFTYGTLQYNVALSPGALILTGANTFATMTIGSGRGVVFPNGVTTTITTAFTADGVNQGYQRFYGVSGSYASTGDSAALSFTGDFTLAIRCALDLWTGTAAGQGLISKFDSTSTQLAWRFQVSTAGRLVLNLSTNKTSITSTATSSASPTISAGQTLWVLVSRRSSDGRVQFFTASGALTNPAASDFTQLGTDQTADTGALQDTSSVVEIGTSSTGTALLTTGNFYRAEIYDGLFSTAAYGGTLQLDADFTTKVVGANTLVEGSANGAIVSFNGIVGQAGDGRVDLYSASGGSTWTISKTSGTVSVNYTRITDSTATGGANWFAYTSRSGGNNSGWKFITVLVAAVAPAAASATGAAIANRGVAASPPAAATATAAAIANRGLAAKPPASASATAAAGISRGLASSPAASASATAAAIANRGLAAAAPSSASATGSLGYRHFLAASPPAAASASAAAIANRGLAAKPPASASATAAVIANRGVAATPAAAASATAAAIANRQVAATSPAASSLVALLGYLHRLAATAPAASAAAATVGIVRSVSASLPGSSTATAAISVRRGVAAKPAGAGAARAAVDVVTFLYAAIPASASISAPLAVNGRIDATATATASIAAYIRLGEALVVYFEIAVASRTFTIAVASRTFDIEVGEV